MSNNTNYARIINHTNTQFTYEETQLLSKGLKYNLHHKHKDWIETLALEAETAISKLNITEQNYYRHAVAKNIKRLSQNENMETNNNKNKKQTGDKQTGYN
jgi:hypothetical protein